VRPVSVGDFVAIARLAETASAQGLTYLSMIAVRRSMRSRSRSPLVGGRPRVVLAVRLSGSRADRGGLAGEGAATRLLCISAFALGYCSGRSAAALASVGIRG